VSTGTGGGGTSVPREIANPTEWYERMTAQQQTTEEASRDTDAA
jgi:hypothetical protein